MTGKAPKPLSRYALDILDTIRRKPQPRQAFNTGACQVIEGRGLAETYMAPTPYATRKGDIQWLRITDAGRAVSEEDRRAR